MRAHKFLSSFTVFYIKKHRTDKIYFCELYAYGTFMKYYKILEGLHGYYSKLLELFCTFCKPTLFFRMGMSDSAKKRVGGGERDVWPETPLVVGGGWQAFF